MDDFIEFGSPLLKKEELNELIATVKSGWIGTGPKVSKFEKNFSKYKNIKYSIAVSSCTSALHLSLITLGIGPGDEVITSAMTFCSTINSIIHVGAQPVLVDIDINTGNIDHTKIENAITKKTKAIIPVHFSGYPCQMDKIITIINRHNLYLIEDCAHAIESEFNNKKTGTFGDFGCFSFYVTKNLVTGEGGMVICKKKSQYKYIKELSLHGMSMDAWSRFLNKGYKHYKISKPGYKYNMTDIQASLGIHQLNKINKNWNIRKKYWIKYYKELKNLPIKLQKFPEKNIKHAFHLFTLRLNKKKYGKNRDDLIKYLNKKNIGVGVHYVSIPEHPYYKKKYKWDPNKYPSAYQWGKETISLPLSPKLKIKEQNKIIKELKLFFI